MPALASYLRHLIVALLLLVVQKYQLPADGADAAANAIALAAFGTLTWAVVKYLPGVAKTLGLLCLGGACLLLMPSCATTTTTSAAGAVVKTVVPDAAFVAAMGNAAGMAAQQAAAAYIATHAPKSAAPAAP